MEVLRLADGDEHLHLVVNELGKVILDNGPAFVRPGLWPNQAGPGDARCVQQSTLCSEQTTRGSLSFFQLLIAARGTLNPARPCYVLLLCVPLWGSVCKKKRRKVASVRGACVRERA